MNKKYLNIYRSEGEFGKILYNIDNKRSGTSFVSGSGTHFGDNLYFGSEDAIAGDILLTNGTDKFFINPEHYRTLKDEGKIGTGEGFMSPIGVCAVPGRLTLKGEGGENKGKARVVSLANMSLKAPEVGSIKVGATEGGNCMVWGDITGVLGEELAGHVSSFDPIAQKPSPTTQWGGNVPSTESFISVENPYVNQFDPKKPTYYYNKFDSSKGARMTFSPYDSTGEFFKRGSGKLKGKELTDSIISKVTANWEGSTIENSYASGHCPTVCSCRRYHTVGTQAGDWYLPSIGELLIMWARMKEVNESLYQIGPSLAIIVGTEKLDEDWTSYGQCIWSSSEAFSDSAWNLRCVTGFMDNHNKKGIYNLFRVRAFLAI